MSKNKSDISNLEACMALVHKFSKERTQMSETQIQELRARLSVGQVYLIEYDYRAALEDLTLAELQMDREEKRIYEKYLKEREEAKDSPSVAKENARRLQKGDEEFLDVKREYLTCKNIVNILDKQIKQLHQVLNSMARVSG